MRATLFYVPGLVLFLLSISSQSSSSEGPVSDNRSVNIREFLDEEGRFDLNAARRNGRFSDLDLSGLEITLDAEYGLRVPTLGERARSAGAAAIRGATPDTPSTPYTPIAVAGTPGWSPQFSQELDTDAEAAIVYDGELWLGGNFSVAGGTPAKSIARWDGTTWHAIGTGANAKVEGFAIFEGDLIVVGQFTMIDGNAMSRVARWNGTSWSALGTGVNTTARCAVAYDGDLVVGGSFTAAGGMSMSRIARWDGAAWNPLDDGFGSTVIALSVFDGELYAGGSFTNSGEQDMDRISKWDGASWTSLGTGTDGTVRALHVMGDELWVGGSFDTAGSQTVNFIARYDGASWIPIEADGQVGLLGEVEYLGEFEGQLVANMNTFGSESMVSWTGSSWNGLSPSPGVGPFVAYQSELVLGAGGQFAPARGVNRWNGADWQALGPAVGDWVFMIEPYGGGHVVGGLFDSVDNEPAASIALWDGTEWSPLGLGVDGVAYCAALYGGDLIVGGYFTNAGGVGADHIARWDGTSWHSLGAGTNGMVRALTSHGGDLIAGGSFDIAGGGSADHIARWDGSSWNSVGSGTNGVVHALVSTGGSLVAGGLFTAAGGVGAENLAVWNGASWSEFGGGVSGPVFALDQFDGSVIVGGYFVDAGGETVNNIAAWSGSSWSDLGTGLDHAVRALDSSSSRLVAGGYFGSAGGIGASYIAAWDGTSWSSLDNGATSTVLALAAEDDGLFAGGIFRQVNGINSPFFAFWDGVLPLGPDSGEETTDGDDDSGIEGSRGDFGIVDSVNVTLLSYFPITDFDPWVADVWGYETESSQFALVCQGNHLTIVDVTNPEAPVLASKVPAAGTDLKDVKTYGHYAYCTNQTGPIQIVDISDPYAATTVGLVGDAQGQHNGYLDTDRGLFYATGRTLSGVEVFDLAAEPADPPLIGRVGVYSAHDLHSNGNLLVLCGGGTRHYQIWDVTDPTAAVMLSEFLHDDPPAPHSAWMTLDQQILYTCDESSGGGLHVYDISDPTDPILVDFYSLGPDIVPHNPHVEGDRLFVSYYKEGLRVLDTTDPAHPYEIGHWTAEGFQDFGNWGVYPHNSTGLVYFTNMIGAGAGLYVAQIGIDVTGIDTPTLGPGRVELVTHPNPTRGTVRVELSGDPRVVLVQEPDPIRIFDSAGRLVRSLEVESIPSALFWDGRSDRGVDVPSGLYFLQWSSERVEARQRVTVLR